MPAHDFNSFKSPRFFGKGRDFFQIFEVDRQMNETSLTGNQNCYIQLMEEIWVNIWDVQNSLQLVG